MSINVALHQRRRKKRPNYGTRTVEVRRGYNNFGFTITGQQPCRLSCIVADSPADQAGLRNGDFLISINGLNVSKLPHETVVQLIGNSFGSIRMQIAENYYSDSSDEENATAVSVPQQQQIQQLNSNNNNNNINNWRGAKPRYLHHRSKLQQRMRNSPQKKRSTTQQQQQQHNETISAVSACAAAAALEIQSLRPLIEDMPYPLKQSKKSCSAVSPNVANVSAMVRVPSAALEYRAIVGYMGTIEMPKQISQSSKLQTVRSCIRKLRQEKRQPTTVLMIILPDCLRLQAVSGSVLASYNSARLNFVSSSSESENRFFGLITSAVHTDDKDDELAEDQQEPQEQMCGHISISNSCHVFVVDTKLCEHQQHVARANEFHIQCTRDPISNMCLEFPNNSEYVVNLIRSMYTMRILPPATRHATAQNAQAVEEGAVGGAAAHSPQPSNHSEISTTTSNSDSGIGFPNDCTNISDRILVVDFPGVPELRLRSSVGQRPAGIFNNFDPAAASVSSSNKRNMSAEKRLTVRAMPDPKIRPNLLANFSLIKSPANSLTSTRSCDDVLALMERGFRNESEHEENDAMFEPNGLLMHASMDDISLQSAATTSTAAANDQEHAFLQPTCPRGVQKNKLNTPDKLSPQVFNSPIKVLQNKQNNNVKREEFKEVEVKKKKTRFSLGFQAFDESSKRAPIPLSFDMDAWSSLQNLCDVSTKKPTMLDITNSEPDLGNQVIPTSASPFRRSWAQSSFHGECEDKVSKENIRNNNKLAAIPASMTASDNEVYLKSSMATTADFQKELKHALSQHQLNVVATSAENQGVFENNNNNNNNEERDNSNGLPDQSTTGPTAWATSFELLLEDAAGLQTFAEFLKKEFSAENIYFWAACKHYQQIENESERSAVAKEIFQKHLSNSATEPVNVDSKARTLTDETLSKADKSIFATAQKQIYNLMKFDSYPRFIRSELYNTCLRAEKKKKPLPFTGEDLDELLRLALNQNNSSKLKTSNSNAEDRRRKSLLPWHRKTRSKSRDRCDSYENNNNVNSKITGYLQTTGIRLPTLTTSGSLKIPSTTQNSMSDLHSSRSSLSSFDTLPSHSNGNMHDTSTLCRVILNDGATTVVPTRQTETVGQMMDRLLEKRGLTYEHYDVLIKCNRKPVDLNSSARGTVAGKEILIEKRVVFKIDLPDPKVISVKSKPNKLLNEVISQILLKYNYNMDSVQVMMGEKCEVLDLSLPVTVADGKRLQIVHLMQNSVVSEDNFRKPAVPSIKIPKTSRNDPTFKGALDEINNQVFDEVRKMRFEANNKAPLAETQEDCSLKSDDCASETSSIFARIRRRDTNIPVFKTKSRKKSTSSQNSEESVNKFKDNHRNSKEANDNETKKPIIAKLKAGVKLQVTERVAEQQDELPEGSKRMQLTTDLNVDKPDALKIKDSISVAASKLRKVRANLSPLPKYSLNEHKSQLPALEKRPQPAPRLSIANKEKIQFSSPVIEITDVDGDQQLKTPTTLTTSVSVLETEAVNNGRGPPPLPPKPKVLPMKPSNWTANSTGSNNQSPIVNKSIGRRSLEDDNCHNILLEGKPSSFV